MKEEGVKNILWMVLGVYGSIDRLREWDSDCGGPKIPWTQYVNGPIQRPDVCFPRSSNHEPVFWMAVCLGGAFCLGRKEGRRGVCLPDMHGEAISLSQVLLSIFMPSQEGWNKRRISIVPSAAFMVFKVKSNCRS